MTEKNVFSVRRFSFSDVDSIIRLLNTVFKPQFSYEWWRWKYELNPNGFFGEKGDIWVAEKNHEIIGHYAVIPEKINFHSKVITVAQSVDTATHPKYRGIGIFTTLANKTYSDARIRYPFIFGFPSSMSLKGFIRMGWKRFPFSQYTKILDFDKFCNKFGNKLAIYSGKLFLKAFSKMNRVLTDPFSKTKGKSIDIQEIKTFSEEINLFWKHARANYKIALARTDVFLNWRFSKYFGSYKFLVGYSPPKNDIIGYIVLRKTENALDIVDLVTLPNEDKAMFQLIEVATKIGSELGAECIHCWFPKWYKVTVLERLGFIPVDQLSRLANKHTVPFILYSLSGKDSPDVSQWFYTAADTDYA